MDISSLDFRLLDIDLELSDLAHYLDLIEEQISKIKNNTHNSLQEKIKKLGLTPDDPDWQIERGIYLNYVDILLPRLFHPPFLVSLYAVYESAVTEIATLVQKKKGITISINDLRGDFLDRAKKYYRHFVDFQLCSNKSAWQGITMLSTLRNAIAHANGRLEMLTNRIKQKITIWEKQKIGISSMNGYIVIEKGFLKDILYLIHDSLQDLIGEYKKWDDAQTSE